MRRRRFDQPDAHELAAERLNAGIGPYEPLPAELKNYNGKRLMMLAAFGLFLAVVIGGRGGASSGPAVSGSCTKPAFAFDKSSVRYYGVVRWSVAGPTGSSVIITADSESPDKGRLAGPVPIKGCKASGRMGVALKGGTHVVRVFLRSAEGRIAPLGTKPLVVTAPR